LLEQAVHVADDTSLDQLLVVDAVHGDALERDRSARGSFENNMVRVLGTIVAPVDVTPLHTHLAPR